MTAREVDELRGLVSPSTTALRVGSFLVAVLVVGWLTRGAQGLVLGGTDGGLPLWLVPTLPFAVFLYARAGRWTGGPELRRKVRLDLERGQMAQHRMRVDDALEAPEVEDEGPVFFVTDDSGATYFFAGQEMARYKDRGFPWREFEIVEAPESGRFFRLKPLGEALSNVEVRAPLTFEEARTLGVMAAPYGRLERSLSDLGSGA